MILNGNQIKDFGLVIGAEDSQYQPHGIDLRMDEVFYTINKPYGEKITEDDYIEYPELGDIIRPVGEYLYVIKEYSLVLFKLKEIIDLRPRIVNIPSGEGPYHLEKSFRNFVGYIYPKSSLSRRGCIIHSALWDSGYKGSGYVLVQVGQVPFRIKSGDAFAQMVFWEGNPTKTSYNGQYQNEGLSR
jgi:deoxycytidine triphosphate deaminase